MLYLLIYGLGCVSPESSVDSHIELSFHEQAWMVQPYEVYWTLCDPLTCWVCVELQADGVAVSWGGHGNEVDTPLLSLGSWSQVESDGTTADAVYQVGKSFWHVQDYSNEGSWTQTGRLNFPEGSTQIWQGSGTYDGYCSQVKPE